ncbi:ABC transporter ATP-binding protein [Olsenella uli]|uniref:ABC transporter ATP-binding protein n=1 Tax=Olsenella uli TaxID=133926 RepID=UPI00241C1EC3|nr:energy-coupling factor ABC transporter ATP-binding protein [Olsenella uli]
MISFRHVSFSYGTSLAADDAGVRDVSLSVAPGEVVVLCGRSGCGKSTLLRLANGLAPRFFPGEKTGHVMLDGTDVDDLATWEIAQRAGSLFQNPRTQFFNVETTGEVAFGLESAGWPEGKIRPRVNETFEELDLSTLADRSIFELSGGERQKIAFASIWAQHPANLLLDESTSNLDLPSIGKLTAFVRHAKEKGCAVLIAEHRLSWLSGIADRYVYLEDGRVSRVMGMAEFAALDAQEVDRMGLRARSLGEVAPAAAFPADASPVRADESLLATRGLSVSYGAFPILRNAPLKLRAGEVAALVGHNGAGKTTLGRALCGFERRARGEVLLDGVPATRKERVCASSMVFQDVNYQLFAESVTEEVTFGLSRRTAAGVDVAHILSDLALANLEERHPATLSGGQKQRLAVAACVAADKRVLVFDEPTSGLDLDGMRRIARLLRELAGQGRAVLVVTHDLELVACACDRALCVEGGTICASAAVAEQFDLVKELMGVPMPQ